MSNTILRVSPHRLDKAMAQAQYIVALALKSGAPITIEVRPVAEIGLLREQVATLVEALRRLTKGLGRHQYQCSDIARAALKAAGVET